MGFPVDFRLLLRRPRSGSWSGPGTSSLSPWVCVSGEEVHSILREGNQAGPSEARPSPRGWLGAARLRPGGLPVLPCEEQQGAGRTEEQLLGAEASFLLGFFPTLVATISASLPLWPKCGLAWWLWSSKRPRGRPRWTEAQHAQKASLNGLPASLRHMGP